MDNRAPLGVQRPHLPQRAVSGGSYGLSRPAPKRPTLQTSLSNVRSASQPTHIVDLTSDVTASEVNNSAAFWGNKEQVVGSPDVINLEDDDQEPPVKRAKTSGDDFRTVDDDVDANDRDEAYEIAPGSPLPNLPNSKPAAKRLGQRRQRFGIESAARKPHGNEPPALATRIPPPKKVADYSPWTGNHPEDVLNENVIKTGFFDKAPASNQAESNSAKATIWPSLSQKNHHGLGLLGHMFTAVIEKRQAIGKSTAPSTFKPPPRLTLPDTKREAWLRDLANSDVPLRKQSRTIPYGVRGKLLMEQCLGKNIPLQRAVWLAKCVGANELRACRRKGISGPAAASAEFKWVREWTVHVEQFLEDIVSTCGQEEWQKKMNYAVKLATAFYSEKLLDTDHYLDWLVSSFTTATFERLPVWIVLIHIYWKEVTKYGQRGRKMAQGILEHLSQISEPAQGTVTALKIRLQKLIAVLAISNRGCLILPRTWAKYKHLLIPTNEGTASSTTADNIAHRNERLAGNFSNTTGPIQNTSFDLYAELDAVGLDVDIVQLSGNCLKYIPAMSKLVPALLDWASSPYRAGMARVYLTSRILAYLQSLGHDTDLAILQYIRRTNDVSIAGKENIHKVIVDLVRQDAFSVGRYLQWLITSGVLSASDVSTCATGLINALPTTYLSPQILNTRKTIIRRLGTSMNEIATIEEALHQVEDATSRSSTDNVSPISLPDTLSTSARLSVSYQILNKLKVMAKEFGIGLGAFEVARNVIEDVKDVSCLSGLISTATTTTNCALLATVADTVNLHAESLAALGELGRLFDGLSEQYLLLRSQQPLDRSLMLSLTGLAERVGGKQSLIKLLRDDIAIFEQQNSLTVCSPASDSLIGMHAGSLDSDDDIDAVFASGNTMDEHLMQRVLSRIMQRALKPQSPGPEPFSRVGGWLRQLRSVDGTDVFDRLVINYLRTFLKSITEETASTPITSLVSSGCVDLSMVADIAKDIKSPQVAMAVLPTFLAPDYASDGLQESERYTYLLQQERCQTERADSLVALIRTACESSDFDADNQNLHRYLIRRVSVQPGSVRRIFESGKTSDTLRTNGGRLVFAILHRDRRDRHASTQWDMPSLVEFAGPLSINLCKGVLLYFRSSAHFSTDDENLLADSLLKSFKEDSEAWPQLLECSGENVNKTVFAWARDQLLSMAMSKSAMDGGEMEQGTNRYLDLLTVTNKAFTADNASGRMSTITERLKELDKEISQLNILDDDSQQERRTRLHQLQIALDLCVMHVHGPLDEDEASNRGKYQLLATLCSLLANPKLQIQQDLIEYLFDLASALSDMLPDVPQNLAKTNSISKLAQDARLIFILGLNTSPTDSWLALASHLHQSGSQQQRVFSRHPSQQMGVQTPASRSTSQGMQSQTQHQRFSSQSGPGFLKLENKLPIETKTTPFPLRRWEIMPDPTPVMGENDSSLSLSLFGARKV